MKLRLNTLTLQNFRSVDKATLEFDLNGMLLLQGHSGAGKSTVNLAIAYAFGFCGIPAKQLTRWGADNMGVQLVFQVGDDGWVIDRAPGSTKLHSIDVEYRGREADAQLQKLLGITPDMLGALTYRPQQEPGAFIRKTDAEKKEFLTQILRLDEFEQAVDKGTARIKKLESELELAQRDVEHLKRAVADAEAAVVDPPSVDEIEQAEASIAEIRARIVENKPRIKELEALNPQAAEKKKLHDEANKHLDKAIADDERRATEFQLQRREDRDALQTLRAKQAKADQVWTKLQMLVQQRESLKAGSCPTCGQETTDNEPLARLDSEIGSLTAKHRPLSSAELEEVRRLEEASTAQFVPSPNIDKLRKIAARFYGEIQVAQEQSKAAIQQLKREDFEGQKTIDQLTRYLTAAKQAAAVSEKSHQAVLQKAKGLAAAQAKLAELRAEMLAEQDFVALVGNQGFLGAIFEEVLQDISMDANEILSRVPNTSNVTIEFKTESVTQKGSIKRSIIPVVSVGGNIGPFDAALSGGMKTMVMLAVDLAVSKVIARRAGIQPGWLILDEPFDGAGSPDREAMLELLAKESVDRLIIVVDHSVDSKGLFSKSIQVSMSGGVTKLV